MKYIFPPLPIPAQLQELIGKQFIIECDKKPMKHELRLFGSNASDIANYSIHCIEHGYEVAYNISKATSKGFYVYDYISVITTLRRVSAYIPYACISIDVHPNPTITES